MVISGVLVFLSYFIVLNTLVPISLYVRLEGVPRWHNDDGSDGDLNVDVNVCGEYDVGSVDDDDNNNYL